MNLNSYLPLPTSPRVATPASDSPVPGPASGTDMVAGQSLGLDFAHIMARQLQQLPNAQRQSFASTSDAVQAELAQAKQHAAHLADKEAAAHTHNQNKSSPKKNLREPEQTPRHARENKQEPSTKSHAESARSRVAHAKTHEPETEATALTPGLADMPHALTLAGSAASAAASVLANPLAGIEAARMAANAVAQELTHPSDPSMDKLQTFALSPKVQIITDPRQAPSSESLMEFARSMGLDDATIQNLMGATASNAVVVGPDGSPLHSAANGLPNAHHAAGVQSSAMLGVTLQGTLEKLNISQADKAQLTQTMTQALNSAVQSPAANANLLQSSAAAPLNFGIHGLPPNGMSQVDMATIQQIQMTVLPPAVLPLQNGNSTQAFQTQSTASVLSLMGGNLSEQDIANLASSFSQDMGGQSDANGSETSGQSSSSGFAQALAQSSAADNRSVASKDATTAVATPLTEVYEQLSDKLATEMAARMHKQLSEGQWKMKFGLRPAHLGGVEIQLEMKDGKLDAVFRADNPMTRDLLQNSTQRLREALENFGIHAGFVQVGQNAGQNHQNASGNSNPQAQFGDNSKLSANSNDTTNQVVVNRGNGSTSLLDLYA
jgi:flagellar hook-length control protein FliK